MLVCVVFVVLLVASVLASMRWLFCGVTVQKNDICNHRKNPAREFFTSTVLINSKTFDPHQITNITVFINWKNLQHAFL